MGKNYNPQAFFRGMQIQADILIMTKIFFDDSNEDASQKETDKE